MSRPKETGELLTLEPLLEAVRMGVERSGWILSGLQKTTSHEFQGKWAGESTRSAYLFFHRTDLPESVAMEAFLDETSDGLRGNLALVLDGPHLCRLGPVPCVLDRVARASFETLPNTCRTPVSLRLAIPDREAPIDRAEVQLRVKLTIPSGAVFDGSEAVSSLCSAVVTAFPKGVFITTMPRAEAAGISTLSTPMPARPMTFRFLAASRIFGVTLVAERIASPS